EPAGSAARWDCAHRRAGHYGLDPADAVVRGRVLVPMTGRIIVAALALIEDHHVERGVPSVMEMHDIRAAMEARGEGGTDPATLAHDTLMALGWRVEMVDGVIYRLER
ncbi:hypothetical protein Q8W71_29120, partial [Methylobacterium sp. NEAU 140]